MSHNPRLTTSTGSVSAIIADAKLTRFGYHDYDVCALESGRQVLWGTLHGGLFSEKGQK